MPSKWSTVTLKKAGIEVIDCDHKTPPASETGFPYVAIPQLKNGNIDLQDVRLILPEHFIEWTRKAKPNEDDVILSRRCNPGETAHVPAGLEFALGQNLVLLRSDGSKVHPKFLRWLVRGSGWWEQIRKYLNVGAVFDSLKCADIPKFELHIPPISEQRAIAHILSTLDDKIELNRRMNETLKSIARAIFKSWFVDFDPVRAKTERRDTGLPQGISDLFPAGFSSSEIGSIPMGWRLSKLGDHIDNFDSQRVPVSGAERAKRRGQYPYYGAASVMDYIDGYLFDGIYLLIGEDGSVIRDNGLAVTQYVWGQFWVNNHAHVIQGKGIISTEQLYLFFDFAPVTPYVTGAVQPKLSQGRMNLIPFVVADNRICTAFVKIVDPLFARLRANTIENRILETLLNTLIPRLISGELRVKDAERIIGEAE